ncbi:DUF72 domain-containing protein [Propylenella binzhouense]|uniref:DUF72 domain-containing protein n=1 Tax=Propylenella binzhouense TaxID=2555902 RepID=A0A964T406_9HYPH|nr:DUF72 domain-containing protein [Propylenella binzhouense]MYZ47904.1 DUF72 domain-containing protein [Propylenella binzhouense]
MATGPAAGRRHGNGAGNVRIGISGWTYPPWRGVFYPAGLPQKEELAFAGRTFGSIEINGTFYRLQTPDCFARWAAATPEDFVFSVKGPRFITHAKRLRDAEAPLANFLASGLLRLGPKLGPLLWQLPPDFRFDPLRLEAFLQLLPRDTDAARALATHHDHRVAGRTWLEPAPRRPLRHALEIRNTEFACEEFVALLRSHGVALVVSDAVGWPRLFDVTADFVYCRLHGSEVLYASGYDDAALDLWAERAVRWARGGEPAANERASGRPAPALPRRDVYIYFDNDAKVRAPFDAKGLAERVGRLLGRQGQRHSG